jgi:hypothetical protein
VLVIDRLLPHVREPAVRLALVRDAFTGLDETHAREIAPAVAETLQLYDQLLAELEREDLMALDVRTELGLEGEGSGE